MSHLRGKNIAEHLAEKYSQSRFSNPSRRCSFPMRFLLVSSSFEEDVSGSKRYQNPKITRNRNSLSFDPPSPRGGLTLMLGEMTCHIPYHPSKVFLASPSAETVVECTIRPDSSNRYASAVERILTFMYSYGSRFRLPFLNPLARKM